MKLLLDAQSPRRLARILAERGHDVIHTLDLPRRNASPDDEVIARADTDDRVVVTKDRDFRDGHLLRRAPRRLLHVTTGNIANDDLLALFLDNDLIVTALHDSDHVELSATTLIVHRRSER